MPGKPNKCRKTATIAAHLGMLNDAKCAAQVEHIEVETIHETAVPVIPVATATTQKPPGAAEGGGEEETRKKLLLQMQLGERDESGYPIIQMDRAMIGQIALDIRPPAVQPPDLLVSIRISL